jgi:redox-sensing transcriptional repressor
MVNWKAAASPKTVSRLSLYRRLLDEYRAPEEGACVYSHELARWAGVSAAQVRRDIMLLGYSGTPNTGYEIRALRESIAARIDAPDGQQVALIGIGNLGKAILSYFSSGRKTQLRLVAAFDTLPERTDRLLYGCRCYHVDQLRPVAQRERISVGIITVPVEAAQETADLLVGAGITGILNFAPAPVQVPARVFVENMDITIKLETVAFFAVRPPTRGR